MSKKKYDLVIIRGDRFEQLPIAMLVAYQNIPIAHIEGGDLSGAIDNKVRHAITALADIHFATNKESYKRLIGMGTDPDLTYNFGSLDVEYAKSIPIQEIRNQVVICHHPMQGEDPKLIEKIAREENGSNIVIIKSNGDNGNPYGKEEYEPEKYIRLIAGAKCLVGNSSSFLKEASIFGTPALIIGDRQKNRLFPENAKHVNYNENEIRQGLRMQLNADYKPDLTYYKEDTSKNISNKIKEFLK